MSSLATAKSTMAVKAERRRGELAGRVLKTLERLFAGRKILNRGMSFLSYSSNCSCHDPQSFQISSVHFELDSGLLVGLTDESLHDLLQDILVSVIQGNGDQKVMGGFELYSVQREMESLGS